MPGNQFHGKPSNNFHTIMEDRGPSSSANSRTNQRGPRASLSHQASNKQHAKNQQPNEHDGPLSEELKAAIRHMVANISKSFIVEWYTSISPTNHDFVASCEGLMEEALLKLAELIIIKLDKYKVGQLVTTLLHDHVLNESSLEKRQSIDHQIDNYEYDICQSSVVRLFGLLSNAKLRRAVFTIITETRTKQKNDLKYRSNIHDINKHVHPKQQYQHKLPVRATNSYPKSFSFEDIILSSSARSSLSSLSSNTSTTTTDSAVALPIKTTSALYTLVIAMLTKAAFMPIIGDISEPKWLYAVIIWLCKKEEREKEKLNRSNQTREESSFRKVNLDDDRRFYTNTKEQGKKDLAGNLSSTSIVVTNASSQRTLDLEEGFDIASANINFNNPICGSLKRPLDNIEIFATEEVKSHNSCYVLYCIRYDGLCYRHPSAGGINFFTDQSDVPIIDKRQTHSVRRKQDTNIRTSTMTLTPSDVPNRRSFRKCMTIKRRFREFVLLQLRLEENPKIRPYMKNIPKPTKLKAATQNIFSLPGINNIKLDQSTIKLRQRFLERFLIALNSSPFIANSYEFKEFFSYNVNPAGTSKSKSTILQVNLNKVFVDSVRSAFSIIRSTLPGDDYHSLNSNSKSDPDAWLTELQQSTLKLHVQTRTSHSKMNLERLIDSKLCSLGDSPTRAMKCSSLERQYKRGEAFECLGGSRGGSLKASMVKSNSSSSNTDSSPAFISRSSSNYSNQQPSSSQSKTGSLESIYHDANCNFEDEVDQTNLKVDMRPNDCKSIQICDNHPIATKFIDIVHYSISKNASCSKSPFNFLARLTLGRLIER